MIFTELTGDESAILRFRADGSTPSADTILALDWDAGVLDLTSDGTGILFTSLGEGNADIAYLEIGADSTVSLLATDFGEFAPTLSPDGQWMAYTSNITGQFEVFVRPFPNVLDGRTPVSNGGGIEPMWSRDGSELFYRSQDDFLVSVSFTSGETFDVESRTNLFSMGPDYIYRPGGGRTM